MAKKFLGILLSLVLICTMITCTAFATTGFDYSKITFNYDENQIENVEAIDATQIDDYNYSVKFKVTLKTGYKIDSITGTQKNRFDHIYTITDFVEVNKNEYTFTCSINNTENIEIETSIIIPTINIEYNEKEVEATFTNITPSDIDTYFDVTMKIVAKEGCEIESVIGTQTNYLASYEIKDLTSDGNGNYTFTLKNILNSADIKVTSKHIHSFSFEANNNVITATCTPTNCPLTDCKATLTLIANDAHAGKTYTGAYLIDNEWANSGLTHGDIQYYQNGIKLRSAPSHPGFYTAKVTSNDVTAETNFRIIGDTQTIIINGPSAESQNEENPNTGAEPMLGVACAIALVSAAAVVLSKKH